MCVADARMPLINRQRKQYRKRISRQRANECVVCDTRVAADRMSCQRMYRSEENERNRNGGTGLLSAPHDARRGSSRARDRRRVPAFREISRQHGA